jgi:hypothetical protein
VKRGCCPNHHHSSSIDFIVTTTQPCNFQDVCAASPTEGELVVIRIRFILLPESLLSKRQEMNHENAWRIGETWLLPKSSS